MAVGARSANIYNGPGILEEPDWVMDTHFLETAVFLRTLLLLNGSKIFYFIFCHELSGGFFVSKFAATSLFRIVIDGVLVECSVHVTHL